MGWGGGGAGSGQWGDGNRFHKAKRTLKNSLTVYEKKEKKILAYFRSINCTNVSIHGCNCCKTGTEYRGV